MQKSFTRLSSSQVAASEAPSMSPVVGLLWEGHQLIRDFVEITDLLAHSSLDTESPTEIRETALLLHRYVTQSLPLHVHDEEQTLEPRLVGQDAVIDAALAKMRNEHAALDPGLTRFLAIMTELAEDPSRHEFLAEELRPLAAQLHHELISHIDAEEQILWPAIVTGFDADTQAVMVGEMKQRRTPSDS